MTESKGAAANANKTSEQSKALIQSIKRIVFGSRLGWLTIVRAPVAAVALLGVLTDIGFDQTNIFSFVRTIIRKWDLIVSDFYHAFFQFMGIDFEFRGMQQHVATLIIVLFIPMLIARGSRFNDYLITANLKDYPKDSKVWSTIQADNVESLEAVGLVVVLYLTVRWFFIFDDERTLINVIALLFTGMYMLIWVNRRLFFWIIFCAAVFMTLELLSFVPVLDEAIKNWVAESQPQPSP